MCVGIKFSNLSDVLSFLFAASFPQFSIPTSNNQTILIGGLLGNQNIIPAQSVAAVTTSKAQELQKVFSIKLSCIFTSFSFSFG